MVADDEGPIVDVGAYNGDSTVILAKNFKRSKIIGFEPNPIPYKDSIKLTKRFKNISMVNSGLSDYSGTASLFVTDQAESSSLYKVGQSKEFQFKEIVSVNITTLDHYFKDYDSILLIKLDVQGSEISVLRGGSHTIAKTRFVLTEMLNAELYQGGCSYFQVDELLRKSNFRIHSIFCDYNYQGSKYWDVLYLNTNYNEGCS
jgi:FkbM family methyltransferase